jgi:hypothetical protein
VPLEIINPEKQVKSKDYQNSGKLFVSVEVQKEPKEWFDYDTADARTDRHM